MTVSAIKVTRALNQSSKDYPVRTKLVRVELLLVREKGIAYKAPTIRLKKAFLTKGLRPRPGPHGICAAAEFVCKTA